MGTSTALVTGASAGIGRVFAQRLAQRGNDLVLVARDKARLEELAAELGRDSKVAVEVLPADLTVGEELAVVEARLVDSTKPIGLLVNNAGFGTFGKFAELPIEAEEREIRLNVVALVRLSHAALGLMVERGTGGVINVSSIAGYQPTPHNATYSATKAYVTSFTEAIHDELHGTGVNAMVLCPGFTRTEFAERAGADSDAVPGFMWDSAEQVVDTALGDFYRGRAVSVPTLKYKALAGLSSVMPHTVSRRIAGLVMRRAV